MEMETIARTLPDVGFTPTHKYNGKLPSTQQISQEPAFDNGKSGAETQ